MVPTTSRRKFLAIAATTAVVGLSGCNGSEPEESAEYSCPDPFPVTVYNESAESASMTVTVRDDSETVLGSETVDMPAGTGPYDDDTVELDVDIFDGEQYTFDVETADAASVSETFEAKCGPVFVFVTETGALEIRDDELDHLRE